MVVADLHVHTTVSDGSMTLADVPAAARRAEVELVAVTDHDRANPDLDAPVTTRDGVTVVHGVELRVDAGDQRVDLLGYGLEPTPAATELFDLIQRDRIARGRAIVECLEDRLGVTLDVDVGPGLGRPDIARAVAASAADYGYQETFDDLIGDGRPCYRPRDVPSFDRGRRVLADACRLVGLAHPLRYADPAAALDLTADLDAVERDYPYERAVDPAPVERAIRDRGLLVTGGSDAHDDRLGLAGLEADDADRFRRAVCE